MDACVGRSDELKYLSELWERTPVSCAVCGRRHLGKTTLLREFTKDKPFIYITGTDGLRSDNLAEINRALSRFSGRKEAIADIIDLFPRIREICGRRKVVVIIDRFSDLAANFEEVSAYLRSFMNRDMGMTKIMLVVCDSDSSVFGRFYFTLELKPMSYIECVGFHPGYTPLQQLMTFAMVGGTPAYHHLIGDADPEKVIRTRMFDHMSVFSLEAEGMVATEGLVPGSSVKVLAAMAAGAESIRDISNRSGIGSSFCSKIVEDLEHKGIVRKETSSGMSRRSVYSIGSNIVRFYYEVVYRHTHMVEFESPEEAYEEARDDIIAYMERGFKTVCSDYVTRVYDYRFVGRLRRKDDRVDDVIDFVATVNEGGRDRLLVASCRLFGDPVGRAELDAVVARAKRVDGRDRVYALFSGCGFTDELREAAENAGNVRLLSLEDVYTP